MNTNNFTITRDVSDDAHTVKFGITEFDGRHIFIEANERDADYIDAAAAAEFPSFSMNDGLRGLSIHRDRANSAVVTALSCIRAAVDKNAKDRWMFYSVSWTVVSVKDIMGFKHVMDGKLTVLLSSGGELQVPNSPELCAVLEQIVTGSTTRS